MNIYNGNILGSFLDTLPQRIDALERQVLKTNNAASGYVTDIKIEYAINDDMLLPPTQGWSTKQPNITDGYIWQRLVVNGVAQQAICITNFNDNTTELSTLYTWVKYASDDLGTDLSDTPVLNGKTLPYIGYAYNQISPISSQNYEDYIWVKYIGDSGVNAKNLYTWVKYTDLDCNTDIITSDDLYDIPTENTLSMGFSANNDTSIASIDPTKYNWVLCKGTNGTSVSIKGSIDDIDMLTDVSAEYGDSYMIDGNLWVYDNNRLNDSTHKYGFSCIGAIQGPSGATPYIGPNGNWWIDGKDTEVKAIPDTPYIGDNGNWFIGGEDTGVASTGKDGSEPIYAYIDNPSDIILTDHKGHIKEEIIVTTNITLYKGDVAIDNNIVLPDANKLTVDTVVPVITQKSNGTISIQWIFKPSDIDVFDGLYKLDIPIKYRNNTYNSVFTLGINHEALDGKDAEIIQLFTNTTSIVFKKDGNSLEDKQYEINVKIKKIVGNKIDILSNLDNYYIYYTYDINIGDVILMPENEYKESIIINQDTEYKYISIGLCDETGYLIDITTIPIIKEALNGNPFKISGSLEKVEDLENAEHVEGVSYIIDNYLWTYNANTLTDNTHVYGFVNVGNVQGPQGIPGNTGAGIQAISELYGVSNSNIQSPMTWYDMDNAVKRWSSTYKYLWVKETTIFTDDTPNMIKSHVIAIFTKDGSIGVGIKLIKNWYKASDKSIGETSTNGIWSEDPEDAIISEDAPYLWNYEEIEYTDSSISPNTYTIPCIIGNYSRDGHELMSQYSIDTLSWHNDYMSGDIYMRTSIDDGNKWTEPIRIKGEAGEAGLNGSYIDSTFGIGESATLYDNIDFSNDTPIDITSENPYLWMKQMLMTWDINTESYINGWDEPKYIRLTGEKGDGIEDIEEQYAVSSDDSVAPTSGWTTLTNANAQWNSTAKYLWNKESTKYQSGDKTNTKAHIVAIYTQDGSTGVGIKSIKNWYKSSPRTTGETSTNGVWYDNPAQTPISNTSLYLWNYEELTYTDNTKEYTPACIIGNYAKNGTSVYAQYSVNGSTNWHEKFNADDKWMRTSNDNKVSWSAAVKVVGEDGEDGQSGPYIRTNFGISSSLTNPADSDFTSDGPIAVTEDKPYLWMKQMLMTYNERYNNYEEGWLSPKYVRLTGEKGSSVTIKSTEVKYATSTSSSQSDIPTVWTTAIPDATAGQYIWSRTIVTYNDNSTTTSYSISRLGIDGKGIKSSIVKYYLSEKTVNDINAVPAASWGEFPSNLIEGYWLYTKTDVTYSDGNTTTSYTVTQVGTGATYAGVSEYYALGESSQIAPGTTELTNNTLPEAGTYGKDDNVDALILTPWQNFMPNETDSYPVNNNGKAKPYIWNFEISRDSAGNKYVTHPVCIGNFSKGIKSIVETYAISNISILNDEIKNLEWTDEQQDAAPTNTKKYQWNKTVVTYTDLTTDTNYHISAVKGDDGEPGDPGTPGTPGASITETQTQYALVNKSITNAANIPANTTWTNTLQSSATANLWQRVKYTWINRPDKQTTTYSTPELNEYVNKMGTKTTYIGDDGIYSGTITADNVVMGNLTAGDKTLGNYFTFDQTNGNLTFGNNVKLAWDNVTGTSGIAKTSDLSKYTTDTSVQDILKAKNLLNNDGTVADLTTYIDANSIITGALSANSVWAGEIDAENGSIGGWTISDSKLSTTVTDGYNYTYIDLSSVEGKIKMHTANALGTTYITDISLNGIGLLYSNTERTGVKTTKDIALNYDGLLIHSKRTPGQSGYQSQLAYDIIGANLKSDGSGILADNNIIWDTSGNLKIGKYTRYFTTPITLKAIKSIITGDNSLYHINSIDGNKLLVNNNDALLYKRNGNFHALIYKDTLNNKNATMLDYISDIQDIFWYYFDDELSDGDIQDMQEYAESEGNISYIQFEAYLYNQPSIEIPASDVLNYDIEKTETAYSNIFNTDGTASLANKNIIWNEIGDLHIGNLKEFNITIKNAIFCEDDGTWQMNDDTQLNTQIIFTDNTVTLSKSISEAGIIKDFLPEYSYVKIKSSKLYNPHQIFINFTLQDIDKGIVNIEQLTIDDIVKYDENPNYVRRIAYDIILSVTEDYYNNTSEIKNRIIKSPNNIYNTNFYQDGTGSLSGNKIKWDNLGTLDTYDIIVNNQAKIKNWIIDNNAIHSIIGYPGIDYYYVNINNQNANITLKRQESYNYSKSSETQISHDGIQIYNGESSGGVTQHGTIHNIDISNGIISLNSKTSSRNAVQGTYTESSVSSYISSGSGSLADGIMEWNDSEVSIKKLNSPNVINTIDILPTTPTEEYLNKLYISQNGITGKSASGPGLYICIADGVDKVKIISRDITDRGYSPIYDTKYKIDSWYTPIPYHYSKGQWFDDLTTDNVVAYDTENNIQWYYMWSSSEKTHIHLVGKADSYDSKTFHHTYILVYGELIVQQEDGYNAIQIIGMDGGDLYLDYIGYIAGKNWGDVKYDVQKSTLKWSKLSMTTIN